MKIVDEMRTTGRLYINDKLSNGQTMHMEFSLYDDTADTRQWNIGLSVFSKRKHSSLNEDSKFITGKNPFESFGSALAAFKMLEHEVLDRYPHIENIIFCTWVDKRRRDAYFKVLHRIGYDYGVINGFKCIMKHYPKQTYEEAV